jgi:small subunit ribosomal protein S14
MKKKLIQEKKKRKIVNLFETDSFIYKSIFKNFNFPNNVRWNALLHLSKLPQNSRKGRLNKRCTLSGRKSSFNSLYRFSRLVFLRLARQGEILGLKKSS